MKRVVSILGLAVPFIFIIISLGLSQESPEYQWVWGEVVSIDMNNKVINIKYLDYETDTEKELSLVVDDKTSFEGINSLAEIKLKDTVSIDYIIEGGKNIARLISVEQPEEVSPEVGPQEEETE